MGLTVPPHAPGMSVPTSVLFSKSPKCLKHGFVPKSWGIRNQVSTVSELSPFGFEA